MRKMILFLLTFAMVFALSPSSVNAVAGATHKPDSDFPASEGWVKITDGAGLGAIEGGTAASPKKYYLGNDIVLPNGWTPAYSFFHGVLDGNGYTVSGLQLTNQCQGLESTSYWPKTGGLFTRLYGNTVIRNLTVEGSICESLTSANISEIGGIAATVDGTVTLENVHSDVNITSIVPNAYVGGFFGQAAANYDVAVGASAISEVTMTDCTYSGTLDACGLYVGGLLGTSIGVLTLNDCRHTGSVTVRSADCCGGGLVGFSNRTTAVNRCQNRGVVTAAAAAQVGGLLGASANTATVEQGINAGTVSGGGTASSVGGIVGSYRGRNVGTAEAPAYTDSGSLTVHQCLNVGQVQNGLYTGGILGFICPAGGTTLLTECSNQGTVSSVLNLAEPTASVGGILGSTAAVTHQLTIRDAVNFGTVSSALYAGGIAGGLLLTDSLTAQDVTVSNGQNQGRVTASVGAGGVVGHITDGSVTVERSSNRGSVEAPAAGGIAYACRTFQAVSFRSCVNFGTVAAQSVGQSRDSAAGILCTVAADGSAAVLQFDRCANLGEVSTQVRGWSRAAGILCGLPDNTDGVTLSLTHCSNLGALRITDFSAAYTSTHTPLMAGLLASVNGGNSTVKIVGCYDNGKLLYGDGLSLPDNVSNAYLKGLCGRLRTTGTVEMDNSVDGRLQTSDTLATASSVYGDGRNYTAAEDTSVFEICSTLNSGLTVPAYKVEEGTLEFVSDVVPMSLHILQIGAVTGDSFSVRLIATVGLLSASAVGFSYKTGTAESFANAQSNTVVGNTVYRSVTASGTMPALSVAPHGAYYLPLSVENIPAEGTAMLQISLLLDGTAMQSVTLTFTDGCLTEQDIRTATLAPLEEDEQGSGTEFPLDGGLSCAVS